MLICRYVILIFFYGISASAHENLRSIEAEGEMTCILSNGVPDHNIGKFPNKANPNTLIEQKLKFCFPSKPHITENKTLGLMTVGVFLNGVPMRPYTAEYLDLTSKRGFSKNPASGWRKQAMHNPRSLGLDNHNGHVDKSGLYHYHSVSQYLDDTPEKTLIGYAPDGFKIIFDGNETSSWRLKSGLRIAPACGKYDGQFEEDFEYRIKSGSLDECNGKYIKGIYTYFVTHSYPFFPRCFKGKLNTSFMVRKH